MQHGTTMKSIKERFDECTGAWNIHIDIDIDIDQAMKLIMNV